MTAYGTNPLTAKPHLRERAVAFTEPTFRFVRKPKDAAGIIFRSTFEGETWYFLTLRASFLSHGGTWSNVGGHVDAGEAPLEAAMRELEEEVGVKASSVKGKIAKVIEVKSADRTYTTFIIDVDEEFEVASRLPAETRAARWFTAEGVDDLDLHPGFDEVWSSGEVVR